VSPAIRALVVAAAAGLLAWGASGAFASDAPPRVGALAAAGALQLVSDADGVAILTAAGLKPGQSASGTVRLTNTGDLDGQLDLLQTAVADVPGAGGGRLSSALMLQVQDISGGSPVVAYSGPLAGLGLATIGSLHAGEERVYRIVATLPDTGVPAGPTTGDNSLQGASMRVTWTWQAGPATPAATATPAPTATAAPPTPLPIQDPPQPGEPGTPEWVAAVLKLEVPWQRVMVTRGVTLKATCQEACRLGFTARVETAPKRGRRKTLMARRVFKLAGTRRSLPAGIPKRIKLRLTPRAVKTLRRTLLTKGRAAVLVRVGVRSARGAATVQRRIVLVTQKRAARHGAAHR
jgi:hypothetical protein